MNAEVNRLLRGIAARIDEAAKKASLTAPSKSVADPDAKPLYSATVELEGESYYVITREIPETSTGGRFETAVYRVGKSGKPNLKGMPLYRTVDFTAEDAKADSFDSIVKGRGLQNILKPPKFKSDDFGD